MIVENVPIDSVIPYARNPRKNTGAIPKVAASLKEFGWRQPIVVDSEMVVIVGHTRLEAARHLGLKEVPIHKATELTPEQAKAYRITDNRSGEEAEWDWDLLKLEMGDLKALDFPLMSTGFDLLEIKDIMAEEKQLGDADDIPPTPEVPATRKGDIIRLGKHLLMCGDSTLEKDMRALMGDDLADLVWTDPPYNVEYSGKTEEAMTIQNDTMSNADFRSFLAAAFRSMTKSMKPGASFYVAHASMEGYNFMGALQDVKLEYRQVLIWAKNSMVLSRSDYHWQHEPIIYGWKGGTGHTWHSDRKQTTLLAFDKPNRNGEHPTMKPSALVEYCIGNSSGRDQIVLDPFGGSGTTLIASEKMGRSCRMMELDEKYADVIIARWEAFTGGKSELIHREPVE